MSETSEIETRVRALAFSMPPSDLGSTRAIRGVVDLIQNERGAERENAAWIVDKMLGEELARQKLMAAMGVDGSISDAVAAALRQAAAAIRKSPRPTPEDGGAG